MRKIGVIIDHNKQYSQNEKCENIAKNNYDQRFSYFNEVMFPRYKEFNEYTLQFQKDLERTDEELFEIAKNLMMSGKQYLQNLETTDANLRCKYYYPVEELKNLQTAIVMNSFCQTKIKMGNPDYLNAVINFEKSSGVLPVLDVVEEKGKKEKIASYYNI